MPPLLWSTPLPFPCAIKPETGLVYLFFTVCAYAWWRPQPLALRRSSIWYDLVSPHYPQGKSLAALPPDQFPRSFAQCPATFFIGLFQDTRHIAILVHTLPWPALLTPTISPSPFPLSVSSVLSVAARRIAGGAENSLSLLALCHYCVDRRSDCSLRSLIVPPFALFFHFHHHPL